MKWENCYMNSNGSICLVTINGTDFCIVFEQMPFDSKWFSQKFKGPGLCYEVGVCIQTSWIVWINSLFPTGNWWV